MPKLSTKYYLQMRISKYSFSGNVEYGMLPVKMLIEKRWAHLNWII